MLRQVTTVVASAALAAIVCYPVAASAITSARVQATDCFPALPITKNSFLAAVGASLFNAHEDFEQLITCGFPYSSNIGNHINITDIRLVVFDSSPTEDVSVQVCLSQLNGGGGSCGPITDSVGTGFQTILPGEAQWQDFNFASFNAYLAVNLPGLSSLRGIILFGN